MFCIPRFGSGFDFGGQGRGCEYYPRHISAQVVRLTPDAAITQVPLTHWYDAELPHAELHKSFDTPVVPSVVYPQYMQRNV